MIDKIYDTLIYILSRILAMISPAELIYFLEVANSLNLSRASERLEITQPSLSAAIKRLETAVATQLFIRHKKGVTLTQTGKQLLAHTKQLLQYWDEVKTQTLASSYEVQGSYIIGCHPSIALRYLPKFLPELLLNYLKLEIQLKHDISRKITEGVINLSIDMGIVVNPIKHPDLVVKKLVDDEITFWQANKKEKVKHKNIENEVIYCDKELLQTQWLLKQLQKMGIKYNRILSSCNLEVIANLTSSGSGIGILPKRVAQALVLEKLIPIPKMPVYPDEICLVYRPENRAIKAFQVITEAIKTLF